MKEVDISGALFEHEGIVIPDWDRLSALIEPEQDDDLRFEAWTEVGRQWLEQLQGRCEGYGIAESKELLLFAPGEHADLGPILRSADAAMLSLLRAMPGLA